MKSEKVCCDCGREAGDCVVYGDKKTIDRFAFEDILTFSKEKMERLGLTKYCDNLEK